MHHDLKKIVGDAAGIAILLFALMLVFGGPVLNGIVGLAHAMGAK